ncbi:bifunctional apoptosis regulator-like [Hoplias malabaricus]|uniref:bifunctional apoptosis regulator-like n=1 Tax=Hoplias malabaricus TaxID=27720 RepID=UPI003462A892
MANPHNPEYVDIETGYLDKDESLLQQEFTCHCCYQVLVDPTTLNCGHNFCCHCLAQWYLSARKNECPECRQIWRGFPKINLSFRDLVEQHCAADVEERRKSISADPKIAQALQAFQRSEQEVQHRATYQVQWRPWLGTDSFFSGVLIALTSIIVAFLVYHWGSGDSKVELLVGKPLDLWTVEEVSLWMESLGSWASPYRETFHKHQVNGRLLNVLSEQDLLKPPYSVENELHLRAMLKEMQTVQELGFKRLQTLWEYKAVNEGKSLFLLLSMTEYPRLSILYLYFFDYYDSFLPFIHISCPSSTKSSEEGLPFRNLETPDWKQWTEFVVRYCLLPYHLLADFAKAWLDVHYWTVWCVLLDALLLTVREASDLLLYWSCLNIGVVVVLCFIQVLKTLTCWFLLRILWCVIPQFVCNCLFYWMLYFYPVIGAFTLIQVSCPLRDWQFVEDSPSIASSTFSRQQSLPLVLSDLSQGFHMPHFNAHSVQGLPINLLKQSQAQGGKRQQGASSLLPIPI